MVLEIVWSVIPFGITMVMFTWGAKLYFEESRPPDNALPIYVVGKQWMWKIEHLEGQREINELHIPVNRPVKLTMTSEDVIHSFFVPAFRTKSDVVPGKYSTEWFTATKPGKYHLFCAEYCGNRHSGMIGWIYVMDPQDYRELAEQQSAARHHGGEWREAVQRHGLPGLPQARRRRAAAPAWSVSTAPRCIWPAGTRWWRMRPTFASRS